MAELPLPGYTVKEAERLAGMKYNTIIKAIEKGEVERVKDINGQWRIPYHSLVMYVNKKNSK